MSDIDFHWSEYIKAGSDAFLLVKALYPLLPKGGDEVAAKIEAAETALQKANVSLAKAWGMKLHDCTFPPQIMLWNEDDKTHICPNCGHRGDDFPKVVRSKPGGSGPFGRGSGGSWMGR